MLYSTVLCDLMAFVIKSCSIISQVFRHWTSLLGRRCDLRVRPSAGHASFEEGIDTNVFNKRPPRCACLPSSWLRTQSVLLIRRSSGWRLSTNLRRATVIDNVTRWPSDQTQQPRRRDGRTLYGAGGRGHSRWAMEHSHINPNPTTSWGTVCKRVIHLFCYSRKSVYNVSHQSERRTIYTLTFSTRTS